MRTQDRSHVHDLSHIHIIIVRGVQFSHFDIFLDTVMAPTAVHLQDIIPVPFEYPSMTPLRPTPDAVDLSSPPRRAPKEHTPPLRTAFAFDTLESAIAAIARGEFVVVMDDEGRENEGDVIVPAAGCSTEQMAWMIKHTRFGLTYSSSHYSALTGLFPSPALPVTTADTSASRSRETASRRCRSP